MIKSPNDVKELVKEYMDKVYPERTWYIVGGFLRDTELDVDFKDVDVFVSGYSTDPAPASGTDIGDRNAYLYYATRDCYFNIDINIIFMRGEWSLEAMTDRCDFGICQVGWCPVEDRTYKSNAYISDVECKTLTLTRATIPERLERMQSKFPGFSYSNPLGFSVSTSNWRYDPEKGEVVMKGV